MDAGHMLGVYSYSHDYKEIHASTEVFLEDYDQIYNLIYEATGDTAESGVVPVDKLVRNALNRVDSLRRAVVLIQRREKDHGGSPARHY